MILISWAKVKGIIISGPKKDEHGVENFENAFKDLSRYLYDVKVRLSVTDFVLG